MEHGCVPSSWQNQITASADCTHPLIGSGRNRCVAATPFHSAATINADANYPCLPEAANKLCTDGRLLKCWSGTVAISVMENSRFFVAAVLTFDNSHNNIPPTNPRRCSFKRVLTNYGAGTAVTNPTSMPGTELRLFLSCDLSGSRPTNRQVLLSRRITIRQSEFYIIGFLRGAFRRKPLRPFIPTHQPTTYMNRPGAWVKRPGFGAVFALNSSNE